MTQNIYIFDTVHYLAWCQAYSLQKNNQRVLELFKARCDLEKKLEEIKHEKNIF